MNYEGGREWIEYQIDRLMQDLKELQENVDYSEPGIYYEYVKESQAIEHRIQELIHQLEDMSDAPEDNPPPIQIDIDRW